MSNALFPTLDGLTFDSKKAPQFSTIIQKAVSGREVRAALQTYPILTWTLTFELLRQATDLPVLMGFYMSRQGSYDPFLYTDPNDNTVAGQLLGAGDGTTVNFPLIRAFGGFNQPVENGVATAVYKNGVSQSGTTWSITNATAGGYHNQITFTSAPANGVAISADFTFSWRVRFGDDAVEFNNFITGRWETSGLKLIGVKL
jgi:uncharacterized protein (TIGR02217 family)